MSARAGEDNSGPVLLFLPAKNEEAAVAGVVRRVPAQVCGRRVVCLVINDGSTDSTCREAAAAGAEVVSMPVPSGLGAAVRTGLREATSRGAAVVAFCDADGEYAPEELEKLVAPILQGRAHYVVGNRFAGRGPSHMLRRRRAGNRVLTAGLSLIARCRIEDGQSGYRALSAAAAEAAEVIHDFNYAQVLTLDMLQKGFGCQEVPITYSFRTSGESFVRLVPYLRAVIPAIAQQLSRNRKSAEVAALDKKVKAPA